MTEKEILALVEKATGQALNEQVLGKLIDDGFKKHLTALPAGVVTTGEDPNPADDKPKGVTFGQFLGDVRRSCLGGSQVLKHMKAEQMVKANSNVSVDVLQAVAPEMAKALSEGTDTAGGYLVPVEQSRELVDLTTDLWSVIPGLCRQVPMRTNSIVIPSVDGGVTVYWIPETSADKDTTDPSGFAQSSGFKPPSSPTFGQLTINAHVAAVKVVVSNQLLDDSDPSVSAYLMGIFAEALGAALDTAILQGTGAATDPITGLDSRIATNIIAVGAEFNFDDIVNLIKPVRKASKSPLPVQLVGNVDAEHVMMKIKDNNGQYIYKGPGEDGRPARIWGQPFNPDENVLSTYGDGGDETRIYAGRFGRDALLGVRQGVIIKTNPWAEPYFSHNQTAFLAEFRQGFNVTSEARFAMLTGVPTN